MKLLITLFICGLFFLSYNPHSGYYSDLLLSFRLHWLILAFLMSLVLIVLRQLRLGGVSLMITLSALLLHLNVMSSFSTPLKSDLQVIQINASYKNPDFAGQLERLHQQRWDILVLQEFSDQNRALLEPFLNNYELYGYEEVEGAPYGIIVISRITIHNRQLVQLDGDRLGYIKLTFLIDDDFITLYTAHPPSPRNESLWLRRNWLLNELLIAVQQEHTPWFIAGDLNTVPWSGFFINEAGNKCADRAPLYASWSLFDAHINIFTGLPIDHCILSEELSLVDFKLSKFNGSDHQLLKYNLAVNQN